MLEESTDNMKFNTDRVRSAATEARPQTAIPIIAAKRSTSELKRPATTNTTRSKK